MSFSDIVKRAKLAAKIKVNGKWAECGGCAKRLICFSHEVRGKTIMLCDGCVNDYLVLENKDGK